MEEQETTAEVLLRRGKRGAASYLQAHSHPAQLLNELLNFILDPVKPVDMWDTQDWCNWLIAGGKNPADFANIVRRYTNATVCGLVWTSNFVAYRCRTCGISPCMSLCAQCFRLGNHEGHDFNMFRSQAGGACDCGDTNVMKDSGFCTRHGGLKDERHAADRDPPPGLLTIAQLMMPRVILRLLQHLRETSAIPASDQIIPLTRADSFIDFVDKLVSMGDPMRRVITQTLTNPSMYRQLTKERDENYELAKQRLKGFDCPIDCDVKALRPELVHETFLDELVFWMIKYECPPKLTCLLLSILPELDYKVQFTRTFIMHYTRISLLLTQTRDSETLSNRVVQVSVQLFSNEALSQKMVEEEQILHVIVMSMRAMMKKTLQQSTLQDASKNLHYVIDCGHHITKQHCYWPVVSDLNNVLSHKQIVLHFLSETRLLDVWFKLLTMYQGMNVHHRETERHVEFEPSTYYAAFSAELEASATLMWALLIHLTDESTLNLSIDALKHCVMALEDFYDAINFRSTDKPAVDQVSFHLPLHRHLAMFIQRCVIFQNCKGVQKVFETIGITDPSFLKCLIAHPLQTIIAFYEIIAANMWVRNGLHMKGQAMTYIQSHFCNSMVDPDIFLLQVCGCQLDSNWFISTVIERFRVGPLLTLQNTTVDGGPDLDEKMEAMLNSLLTFLATLTSVRVMMNVNEEDCTRDEMVSLLCMSDRTHSQIIDLLPEKCGQCNGTVPQYDKHMNAVADYKAPNFEVGGHMIQGTYTPKASVWENSFDPIHTLLRSVHRKDYQAALNRFAAHTGIKNCWPPYRIPPGVHEGFQDPRKLLFCSSLQALAFVILHKAVSGRDEEIDEQILSLATYLLEMAVEYHSKDTCQVCRERQGPLIAPDEVLVIPEIGDGIKHFQKWYPTSCPIISSLTLIKSVEIVEMNGDATESASKAVKVTSMDLDIGDANEQAIAISQTQHGYLEPELGLLVDLRSENAAASSSIDNSQYALLLRHPVGLIPSHSGRAVSCAMETDDGDGDLIDFSEDATMASLPAPMPVRYLVGVNESIVSLLLKLYAKLASASSRSGGGKDSSRRRIYRTPQEEGQVSVPTSRIGDGVHFIGILLDRYCLSHSSVEARVRQIRDSIWPSEVQNEGHAPSKTEAQLKEERRRKAKERQQKLMQEFANRQKSFLKQCNEVIDDEMPESEEKENKSCVKEYECVICSQTSPSTAERPVAMVVLLQATSVLGHARPQGEAPLNLPCSDSKTLPLSSSRAGYSKRKFDELTKHFDLSSWYRAANIGWEGGVHVQTCGHYLHVDCHKSYMLSQRSQHHQDFHRMNQTLAPERGEYLCPLCRQLANSVLPIHPSMGEHQAVVQCNPRTHKNVAIEMSELMAGLPTPSTSILKEMLAFMEDLTNATYVQYRTHVYQRTTHLLSLFVCSLARTNLEIDLLLHDCQLPSSSSKSSSSTTQSSSSSTSTSSSSPPPEAGRSSTSAPKKSCFLPLFHVLALHLKVHLQDEQETEVLAESPLFYVWHSLTGLPMESTTALAPVQKHVPFLIRDISSIIIELLLSLPINIDKVYFTCVVRVLYSLAVTQCNCRTLSLMTKEERQELRERLDKDPNSAPNKFVLIVMEHMEKMAYLSNEETDEPGLGGQQFETYIEKSVTPFLRICALLQMHLFNEEMPKKKDTEFRVLSTYLGLAPEPSSTSPTTWNALSLVQWVTDGAALVSQWCRELEFFVEADVLAARYLLVDQPLNWQRPYLLGLPKNYSTLFECYHRELCSVCQFCPSDPSLCLACGTLVCLREACCRRQDTTNFEAVQHSIDCGAGTAVFLVVNSTSIILIRGKRACLWGSVYLDSFGEEDRDLKRGKPLYLSEERYALLQHQWVTHSFDHCSHKRWAWHKDCL